MALKPVQDPNLLAALEAPEPQMATGPKPVTDPAVLAQLEGPAPLDESNPEAVNTRLFELADAVPTPENQAEIQRLKGLQKPVQTEEPGLFDRAMKAVRGDPIIDMWVSSLGTAAKGAPETAMNMIGNTGVMAAAGLTAPLVSENMDDAANYINDFTEQNLMRPQSESAQQLTEALGIAAEPVGNIKRTLGEKTLELTGSPDAAATMDMAPDFLATVLGVPGVTKAANKVPQTPLKADPTPPSPMVEELRAADIRLRPSDVRAIVPDKNVKVKGERREKFADPPELKKDLTLHNQTRMSQLAAEEIGAKGLDEVSLTKAEEPAAATYNMVEDVLRDREMSPEFVSTFREAAASAKLPKGEGVSVTRMIGALRRRAAKRLQSDDVKTEEAGFADRDLADRLEEAMGAELKAVGEPQLLKEYQDARQVFAKVNDVRTATRANQIDANALFKIQNKTGRLTGRLKLIADASEFAPNVTKHSTSTAARAGDEVTSSREGFIKELLKGTIRKIPGMDVGAEGFQMALGKPDSTRVANYGRRTDPITERSPEQGELDIREALGLEMPPGQIGMPPRSQKPLGPQLDALGEAFEFEMPAGSVGRPNRPQKPLGPQGEMLGQEFEFEMAPGEVGVQPPAQLTLQDLLGLGDPLTLKKPPGRVGKQPRGS